MQARQREHKQNNTLGCAAPTENDLILVSTSVINSSAHPCHNKASK
jgi:hypothetical protein